MKRHRPKGDRFDRLSWVNEVGGDLQGAKRNAFECGAGQFFRGAAQYLVYNQPHLQKLELAGYEAAESWTRRHRQTVYCGCCRRPYQAFEVTQ